jgi:DNA-binding Lrp family transcriptional regulator
MLGDKQERIIRVLLHEKEPLSKNELSKRANCTRPWVIQFLKKLEKLGLVKVTKVVSKKKLIVYWQSIHKNPKKIRCYFVKDPLKLLRETRLDYVLTTYQAENIVQHHLFPSRFDIYIKETDLQKWHDLMIKNGLYGKGNVRLIIADEHVGYGKRKIDKISIVSTAQLIIDLFSEGGPCAEAAEMLLKNV